jgi:hypothetical protein
MAQSRYMCVAYRAGCVTAVAVTSFLICETHLLQLAAYHEQANPVITRVRLVSMASRYHRIAHWYFSQRLPRDFVGPLTADQQQ